jgi:DNA polymerase-4
MDAFYASIEQRDHPEWAGKPVIVGAVSPRGVVTAASYEARKFGVRSAMAGFRAHQLCPDAVFVSGDLRKYAKVSAEVHRVFDEFSPEIEPIALDEAFLDISGSVGLFGGPLELGLRLKRRVREAVNLPISVGIAPTKMVAKIACTLGKPDGILLVPPEAVHWLIDPLPVRRIWGVGPVLGAELEKLGIHTIAELARFDPEALRRSIGDRARSLQQLARGEDEREVRPDRDPKSYGEENTFERDVRDRETVSAALTVHAEAVARRLRHDGHRGRVVTLKIKLGTRRGHKTSRLAGEGSEPIYPLLTRRRTLRAPTDDGSVIRQTALELWDRADVGEPVRLLGVAVSGIEPRAKEQLELFVPDKPRDKLGLALDAIQAKFGRGAIRRAAADPGKIAPGMTKKRGESEDE